MPSVNDSGSLYGLSPGIGNVTDGDLARRQMATSNTNGSLGTINLDALLKRQDNRLERIDQQAAEFAAGGLGGGYGLGTMGLSGGAAIPGLTGAGGQAPRRDGNDELQALDTLLFDILKNN